MTPTSFLLVREGLRIVFSEVTLVNCAEKLVGSEGQARYNAF